MAFAPRALLILTLAPATLRAAPVVEESAAERRAVRGVPVEESQLVESAELRELRRFQEGAFSRGRDEVSPPVDDGAALPAGLEGRWGGSGDLPPELRSPEATRRVARLPAQPNAEWLGQLTLPDVPVRWEPHVLRLVQYFSKDPRGRAIMSSFLRKQGRFLSTFSRILDRLGVPRDLIYLAMIESGYEPGAVSRVGAGGIWQFMPEVGRAYGLEVSHWVDARRDPEKAAEAAGRYLKDLHVRFGHWHLAFAAYHAGYGGILRAISRYNTNDYWELCKHEAGLPWETTHYVPKILAVAIIGHNKDTFGFGDIAIDPPWEYERVQVPAGTTLATVARAAAARQEVIEGLNPELIRGRTPPDRGTWMVRVPVGAAASFADAMEKARTSSDRLETVVLKYGESVDELAKARGISTKDLKKLNGIKDTVELRGGTTVVVPARPAMVAASKAATPQEDDEILVAVPERSFNYEGRERVFYRTRDGDSLDEIAGVFRASVDQLLEWNNLDPDAKLHPKLVLQLYVRKDFDRAGVALLDPTKVRVVTLGSEEFLELQTAKRGKTRLQYTARAGDTLAKIARRYGLQPGDLARVNRLSYTADLTDGQRIIVYSPTPELPREITVGRAAPHTKRPPAKPVAKPLPGKATAAVMAKKPPPAPVKKPVGKK